MDNLITGNLRNIENLFGNDNFKFIKQDVTEYIHINGDLDYVLHFSSPASPADYAKYPIQTLKVGALGTHKTLGLAKEKKAKYLLASTSEVYGDPLVSPQSEEYWGNVNPVGPRGVYDEAKRFAEAMTIAYNTYHKIDVGIARIFNTYGPKMRKEDGRAVPNFINQALSGKPLTIHGNGTQTRSFCYVSDMVEGIYKLMISDIKTPVNLGNPEEMTILELANVVLKLTRSNSEIIFEDLPVDDPKIRRPDITKAKRCLNWEPKIGLEDGLKETINYFRSE
jgi:dTDP-glucose 4,6-dehydratase